MKSTIDSAGRIVIPRDIREAAGLEAGTVVEIGVLDGVVSIEPAAAAVRIARRGKLRVAIPVADTPALTEEEVRTVRESVRRR